MCTGDLHFETSIIKSNPNAKQAILDECLHLRSIIRIGNDEPLGVAYKIERARMNHVHIERYPGGWYWMAPDHTTDRPVVAAIAGRDITLMVDAGASPKHAQLFLDGWRATSTPPIKYVVLTHSHWDHVFGSSDINAPLISTTRTQDHLKTMATYSWLDDAIDERVDQGLDIPFCRDMIKLEMSEDERARLQLRVPEFTFEIEKHIDLGGGTVVQLIDVGGDHAADSCIVVLPGEVALLSDCIYPIIHTEPNYLTRRNLYPLLDRLLQLDVKQYVLGHHDEPLDRAAFETLAQNMKIAGDLVLRHCDQQETRLIDVDTCIAAMEQDLREDPSNSDEISSYIRLFHAGLAHGDY